MPPRARCSRTRRARASLDIVHERAREGAPEAARAASPGDRGRPARCRSRTASTQRSPTSRSSQATGPTRSGRTPPRSAAKAGRRARGMKNVFGDRARHPGRDRRLRRHRRHRLQRRRRRDVRLPAAVGGRARRGRDHHVRRDVRARRGGLGDGRCSTRSASGSASRSGSVALVAGRARQPDDARGGDRRRRDRAPAPLGPPLPGAARARRRRARARPLADAVRVDRAGLRLRRPRTARLRGRGVQAPPGLGRGRARLRPVDRNAADGWSTPTSSSASSGRR